MEKEEFEYVAIESSSGRSYIGKLKLDEKLIEVEQDKHDKTVVKSFHPREDEYVYINDVYVIVQTQVNGGIQPVPVKFSDMPTGSSRVCISGRNIAEFNVIDKKSKIITAIRASESDIITSASSGDIEKSSRIVTKFSGR